MRGNTASSACSGAAAWASSSPPTTSCSTRWWPIKFLLPEALHSAEAVARFEREARAAVKIKSEHVARVTDVGRLDTGAPYMVMELLRGRDLGAVLQEYGPLPLEDVADYLLQAGEAIAEAHGLGIVRVAR